MKATKCKECGEQIPSNAEFCPNCGCPIKQKSKLNIVAISIGIAILCIVVVLFCILGNKFESNKYANDSISQDSVMQPSATEQKKVTVDPSLVRTGGYDYYASEIENGREIIGGIVLVYNVDSTQNCQGTLRYYPNGADNDSFDIPVIGEIADDGGLIFKGKLDNVSYSLHIKNTHGTLSEETLSAAYDAVFTKGNESRPIFLSFEHCGEAYEEIEGD